MTKITVTVDSVTVNGVSYTGGDLVVPTPLAHSLVSNHPGSFSYAADSTITHALAIADTDGDDSAAAKAIEFPPRDKAMKSPRRK